MSYRSVLSKLVSAGMFNTTDKSIEEDFNVWLAVNEIYKEFIHDQRLSKEDKDKLLTDISYMLSRRRLKMSTECYIAYYV